MSQYNFPKVKLADIRFDEYSRECIDKQIRKCMAIFLKYNISILDNIEPCLKKMSISQINEIYDLKSTIEKLHLEYPKLRHCIEFSNLECFLNLIGDQKKIAELNINRIKLEIQKMYPQESEVSNNIPFSDFKQIYEQNLQTTNAEDLVKLDYKDVFIDTTVKWLIYKSGFQFNPETIIRLRDFKLVNEKVCDYAITRIFVRYLRQKFSIIVTDNKTNFKTLIKKNDEFGKTMKLNPDDIIIFEASLTNLEMQPIIPGTKFKYPDSISGVTYVATSRYVMNTVDVKANLFNCDLKVVVPISVAMLKAQLPNAAKSFLSAYSKKIS